MKKQFFLLSIFSLVILGCKKDDTKDKDLIDEIGTDCQDSKSYFCDNFDSYEDGSSLTNLNPFDSAGNTKVSSEQSYSGKFSAKMEIKPDNKGGFGNWGGIIRIEPNIPKGGEVWVSLKAFWPASFEFSASPWMKFLRFHNQKGDGTNGGYNDLYIDEADSNESVLRCIKEIHDKWEVYDGNPIARDTWETYEMYLFIDDIPVDEGGNARMRIWRDGELIFDRTDVPTITEAQGVINAFYLFTYWNNENPPDNYMYIDDLIIATDANPPINKDDDGNVFIGN